MLNQNALSGFSLGATLFFCLNFIRHIYGAVTMRIVYIGPNNLNEISWIKESLLAMIVGVFLGWFFYKLDVADKAKGKHITIPRIKFKNFWLAVLFFTLLFFGFIFIFIIREYNVKMAEISYMFRQTFWQYCAGNIPWPEIVATSIIFGIILAVGLSKSSPRK